MRAVILALLLALAALPAAACSGRERCTVAEGYYLALPPPQWDGRAPLPVVVFIHGWNSSPEGMLRNRALIGALHRRGAMLVLPWAQRGYWRQIGPGRAEPGRDEAAYIRRIMTDLARHWPVDRSRILVSGFSRGASLVWNLACYTRGLFTAFAPISGGFWHDTPASCPSGPVRLRHIHGRRDRVVAYDRQGIYDSAPIPEGLALLSRINGCDAFPPGRKRGRLACARATCATGAVEICLHDGGHSIPAQWVAEGYDWMIRITGE